MDWAQVAGLKVASMKYLFAKRPTAQSLHPRFQATEQMLTGSLQGAEQPQVLIKVKTLSQKVYTTDGSLDGTTVCALVAQLAAEHSLGIKCALVHCHVLPKGTCFSKTSLQVRRSRLPLRATQCAGISLWLARFSPQATPGPWPRWAMPRVG